MDREYSSTVKGNQDGVTALSQPSESSPAVDTVSGTSLKFGNNNPLKIDRTMSWTTSSSVNFGINWSAGEKKE